MIGKMVVMNIKSKKKMILVISREEISTVKIKENNMVLKREIPRVICLLKIRQKRFRNSLKTRIITLVSSKSNNLFLQKPNIFKNIHIHKHYSHWKTNISHFTLKTLYLIETSQLLPKNKISHNINQIIIKLILQQITTLFNSPTIHPKPLTNLKSYTKNIHKNNQQMKLFSKE